LAKFQKKLHKVKEDVDSDQEEVEMEATADEPDVADADFGKDEGQWSVLLKMCCKNY